MTKAWIDTSKSDRLYDAFDKVTGDLFPDGQNPESWPAASAHKVPEFRKGVNIAPFLIGAGVIVLALVAIAVHLEVYQWLTR